MFVCFWCDINNRVVMFSGVYVFCVGNSLHNISSVVNTFLKSKEMIDSIEYSVSNAFNIMRVVNMYQITTVKVIIIVIRYINTKLQSYSPSGKYA